MCDGKGAAWTEDERAAARERLGIKPSVYAFEVLAKGTIPANTITTLEEGNAYVDTGITLGMLKRYKVFNLAYRCDDARQYYGFRLKENNLSSTFIYAMANATCATIMWVDDAKTAMLSSAVVGNVHAPSPLSIEIMDKFDKKVPASNAGSGMVSYSDPGIKQMSDDAKLYAGVLHMNGYGTNLKNLTWSVCGVVK